MWLQKLFLWTVTCIYLPLVLSVNIVIEPKEPIKLKYGEDLSLQCRIEESPNVSLNNYVYTDSEKIANDLKFTLGGKELRVLRTKDKKSISIFKEKPKIGRYIYYCSTNGQNELKLVEVGAPPSNVTNFKCISENLEALTCSWNISPDDYKNLGLNIKMKYDLVYIVNGNPTKSCDIQVSGRTMSCSWSLNTKPVYKPIENQLYFKLSATNLFGSNDQFFQINHYSIVKPKPPIVELNSYGPHEAVLILKLHPKLELYLRNGVECKIQYQMPYFNNTIYTVKENLILKNLVTLPCALPYANTEYQVRVFIKTTEATSDEFWSEASEVKFTTKSEIPSRPPDIPVGAFESQSYGEDVQQRIYWKQLAKYEEAGDDFKYVYKRDNVNMIISVGNIGYLNLTSKANEALHMSIWSKNKVGFSTNYSYVFIPAHYDTNVKVHGFSTFSYGNGTYVLSWKNVERMDNFTLFWCVHNESRICKQRIDFATIDGLNDKHVVNLPNGNRYQFAISANKGSKSSGMKWSKCELSPDTKAMTDFIINTISTPGPNYVNLIWDWDCVFIDGLITGYNIIYYPENEISNTKYKYINNATIKNTIISGLNPFTKYQFIVSANTIFGSRSISSPRLVETLQDKPSRPNIKLVKVTTNTVIISVERPYLANGNIKFIYFHIYDNETEIQNGKCRSENDGFICEVRGLDSFTNYSLSVKAYNSELRSYSEASQRLNIRTTIGQPSVMTLSRSDSNNLQWFPPQKPAGNIDFYQIKIKSKDGEIVENISRSKRSYQIESCADITYTIRAVNKDENPTNGSLVYYEGEWSNELITTCGRKWWWWALTMFIILGGIIILIVIFISRKASEELNKKKDIGVIFPPGLLPKTDIPVPDNILDDDNESHGKFFSRLLEWAKIHYSAPIPVSNKNYNNIIINDAKNHLLLFEPLLKDLPNVKTNDKPKQDNEDNIYNLNDESNRSSRSTVVYNFCPSSSGSDVSICSSYNNSTAGSESLPDSNEDIIPIGTSYLPLHALEPDIIVDKSTKSEPSPSTASIEPVISVSKISLEFSHSPTVLSKSNMTYDPKKGYYGIPNSGVVPGNLHESADSQPSPSNSNAEPIITVSEIHQGLSRPGLIFQSNMTNDDVQRNIPRSSECLALEHAVESLENQSPNRECAQSFGPTNMYEPVASISSQSDVSENLNKNKQYVQMTVALPAKLYVKLSDIIPVKSGQLQTVVAEVHHLPTQFKGTDDNAIPCSCNFEHLDTQNSSEKILKKHEKIRSERSTTGEDNAPIPEGYLKPSLQ